MNKALEKADSSQTAVYAVFFGGELVNAFDTYEEAEERAYNLHVTHRSEISYGVYKIEKYL
jgi:hypothetical protein